MSRAPRTIEFVGHKSSAGQKASEHPYMRSCAILLAWLPSSSEDGMSMRAGLRSGLEREKRGQDSLPARAGNRLDLHCQKTANHLSLTVAVYEVPHGWLASGLQESLQALASRTVYKNRST
jgi:hypothetical protein